MFWLFAMAATAGLILGMPPLFQALNGEPASSSSPDEAQDPAVTPFLAFALLTGGLGGLLALAFEPTDLIAVVIAACLGLAGGALHPELLAAARKE